MAEILNSISPEVIGALRAEGRRKKVDQLLEESNREKNTNYPLAADRERSLVRSGKQLYIDGLSKKDEYLKKEKLLCEIDEIFYRFFCLKEHPMDIVRKINSSEPAKKYCVSLISHWFIGDSSPKILEQSKRCKNVEINKTNLSSFFSLLKYYLTYNKQFSHNASKNLNIAGKMEEYVRIAINECLNDEISNQDTYRNLELIYKLHRCTRRFKGIFFLPQTEEKFIDFFKILQPLRLTNKKHLEIKKGISLNPTVCKELMCILDTFRLNPTTTHNKTGSPITISFDFVGIKKLAKKKLLPPEYNNKVWQYICEKKGATKDYRAIYEALIEAAKALKLEMEGLEIKNLSCKILTSLAKKVNEILEKKGHKRYAEGEEPLVVNRKFLKNWLDGLPPLGLKRHLEIIKHKEGRFLLMEIRNLTARWVLNLECLRNISEKEFLGEIFAKRCKLHQKIAGRKSLSGDLHESYELMQKICQLKLEDIPANHEITPLLKKIFLNPQLKNHEILGEILHFLKIYFDIVGRENGLTALDILQRFHQDVFLRSQCEYREIYKMCLNKALDEEVTIDLENLKSLPKKKTSKKKKKGGIVSPKISRLNIKTPPDETMLSFIDKRLHSNTLRFGSSLDLMYRILQQHLETSSMPPLKKVENLLLKALQKEKTFFTLEIRQEINTICQTYNLHNKKIGTYMIAAAHYNTKEKNGGKDKNRLSGPKKAEYRKNLPPHKNIDESKKIKLILDGLELERSRFRW